MNRIQRLVQDREKTNKIMIVLAIITVACLIINYMFYDELGIFFFIGIGAVLLIGFFIYQINEYKKPTEDMIKFEEKYKNFSKLYVNLTGRPNLDDLMVKSVDGRKPVVGKDNYGIFIYIVDKEEELFEEKTEESEIEYVEEVSEQKMKKLDKEAEELEDLEEKNMELEREKIKEENIKFTDMTDFLYGEIKKEEDSFKSNEDKEEAVENNNKSSEIEEVEKSQLEDDIEIDTKQEIPIEEKEGSTEEVIETDSNEESKEYIDKVDNKDKNPENAIKRPRDKYTRIRIDKKKLEKKLRRKFHTDKDTINLIYEFSKSNSRYALRYFDDVDKFTINNFY